MQGDFIKENKNQRRKNSFHILEIVTGQENVDQIIET